MHNLIRKSSFEVKHDSRRRHKDAAHIKSGTTLKHARLKKTPLADSNEDHSTKRNILAGSEETGANRARMQKLDKYFVHPEEVKETPRKESGLTNSRELFLSALPLDGLYTKGPNGEMSVRSGESEVSMTQNLNREVSTQFLNWSRKGLGDDKATEKGFGVDGLHVNPVTPDDKFYGENSMEGRKIVGAASLVESSLESQGTGLTEPMKYPGEKVGNRARAFQYFLPTHSPIKMRQRSRYRYVNSLIKPQLAGILADLTGLEAQRDRAKPLNLKSLKDSLKSGESVTETQLREAQNRDNDSGFKAFRDAQNEKGNTQRKAGPQYNANDNFMLGSPDRPNYLQGVFLANPQLVHLFPGSGDERYLQNKHKGYSVVRPKSRWQENPGTLSSYQSKIPEVSFGKLQESVLQESTHSGAEMSANENSEDLNLKISISSKADKKLKATAQASLQSLKDKATSYVDEESNSFQNRPTQGSGVHSASGQDSSETITESPSSYFRPTKMHGFPKVTTLPFQNRPTQGSGVLSASGQDSSEKQREESPSPYFRPTNLMHGSPKVTTLPFQNRPRHGSGVLSASGQVSSEKQRESFSSYFRPTKMGDFPKVTTLTFQNRPTQGSGVLSAIGQDSSEKQRDSPLPYFRPTTMRGFPKVTTLRSYTRTTIPHRSYNFEYESWASSSGEGSGSGEDVMLHRAHHQRHNPTQSAVTSLSTALKTQKGKR